MKRGRAIALSGLVTVVAVVAATVYGGGGDEGGGSPGDIGSRTVGGPERHVIPSPEAGERETLLSDLRAIDPAVAADEDQAVEDARWICVDIRRGQPEDVVRDGAAQRFRVTWEQSGRVLEAIEGTFC
ncbi:hypothetical protein [Streptomyces pactum]|uniref:DUF732 domain-containing protein n=1 Tax=Streptomyces pactum TaxID=68249 RepID=A0A1S6J9X8_9ACTN|nr:hypothetical protein [Streptomyces pactum]AQS68572.1 hypothetical protein B1H29_17985 [Streptomyces pactum]